MTVEINRRVGLVLLLVIGAVAALFVGVLLGRRPSETAPAPASTSTPLSPVALATVPPTAPPPFRATVRIVQKHPNATHQALPGIDGPDAYERYKKGDALFVDARDYPLYVRGHIPGAVSMPEKEAATRFGELPTDKDIIVYCDCLADEESSRMTEVLLNKGVKRALVFRSGLIYWVNSNLPMVAGTPYSQSAATAPAP